MEPKFKRSTMLVATAAACIATALGSACTSETREVDLGQEPGQGGFSAPDASKDSAPDGPSPDRLLCLATECPVPFTTCGNEHRCSTDLANDVENCGVCGHQCPRIDGLDIMPRCSAGKCRYECGDGDHVDCNLRVEDGCEVNRRIDPTNCGACGNVCPAGVRCVEGTCGCSTGLTDCNERCTDLLSDNANCKDCGNVCPPWTDAGWPEPPPHMEYRCRDAECKKLQCERGFANCDGILENGCEVDVAHDPKNCGKCGAACEEDQLCGVNSNSGLTMCLCSAGLTRCGSDADSYRCVDLLNDSNNCGVCDNHCMNLPNTRPHVIAQCNQGRCKLQCAPGFADCDGDPANGCEVNIRIDGSNCGACGSWCNAAAGQPCVNGVCLTTECDAGEGPTR